MYSCIKNKYIIHKIKNYNNIKLIIVEIATGKKHNILDTGKKSAYNNNSPKFLILSSISMNVER